MFTSINQKLEEYLPPAILELQRDEIHQCVFYNALQVSQKVIDEFGKVCILYIYYVYILFNLTLHIFAV
jgi:glycine cleavage system protein P-like pyridoxal-binding family